MKENHLSGGDLLLNFNQQPELSDEFGKDSYMVVAGKYTELLHVLG